MIATARREEVEDVAERVRAEALASMCHELRMPLDAIVGFTSLLGAAGESRLTGREQRWVRSIAEAAGHMQRLMEGLVELRRLDHVPAPRPQAVDVSRIIDQAVEATGALLESRGHTVNMEVGEGAEHAMGDAGALLRILLELVSNAARFTGPGGTIEVRSYRRAAAVVIEVQDSGPGIAGECLPHLFCSYATPGPRPAGGLRGAGVGLALTRSLVLRQGGSIGVVSVPGRGATFRVELPAPPVAAVRAPA